MDRGLFVDLADKMANAVQNLQPKLNIWTTGTAGLGLAALPLSAGAVKIEPGCLIARPACRAPQQWEP